MQNTTDLSEQDNGKTIICHKEDVISISLAWRPSTGYFWRDTDTTAATLESIKHEGGDTIPGASVEVKFQFKITQSGEINLHYARPWSETSPTKWFEIKISVV